jgi:transposase
MKRFVEGEDRLQVALLPHCLDDYVTENNPVRVIEAFIDELDLVTLGFEGVVPETTGRPAYHPATLLKLYLYGYLNRIPSSRRLERETQRNIELMWLTGRLMPDFKTVADFRKDNGPAIGASTPARYSITSVTRISSTRPGTPSLLPTGSRISGVTEGKSTAGSGRRPLSAEGRPGTVAALPPEGGLSGKKKRPPGNGTSGQVQGRKQMEHPSLS